MTYETRAVEIDSRDWILLTNKIAMIQFNSNMIMVINSSGSTPSDNNSGFNMVDGEKYINSKAGLYIWVKSSGGSSEDKYVIIAEEV